MAKIYLSHSGRDADLAKELELRFQRKGHSFTFTEDTLPATNWRKAFADALRSADVVIPLLTQNGLQSNFVVSEIGAARVYVDQRGVLLAPIIFGENTGVPALVSDYLCFFLLSRDVSDIDTIVNQIHSAISQHIKQAPETPIKQAPETPRIFISYSHKDTKWLKRLQVHLKPLERRGSIQLWDDTLIHPGTKWKDEIKKALTITKVAILLVSADFLASEFILRNELPPLLKAAKFRGVIILPIIVSPCLFEQTENLSQFQSVNPPSRPLSNMIRSQQEQTLVNVSEIIQKRLNL